MIIGLNIQDDDDEVSTTTGYSISDLLSQLGITFVLEYTIYDASINVLMSHILPPTQNKGFEPRLVLRELILCKMKDFYLYWRLKRISQILSGSGLCNLEGS